MIIVVCRPRWGRQGHRRRPGSSPRPRLWLSPLAGPPASSAPGERRRRLHATSTATPSRRASPPAASSSTPSSSATSTAPRGPTPPTSATWCSRSTSTGAEQVIGRLPPTQRLFILARAALARGAGRAAPRPGRPARAGRGADPGGRRARSTGPAQLDAICIVNDDLDRTVAEVPAPHRAPPAPTGPVRRLRSIARLVRRCLPRPRQKVVPWLRSMTR